MYLPLSSIIDHTTYSNIKAHNIAFQQLNANLPYYTFIRREQYMLLWYPLKIYHQYRF